MFRCNNKTETRQTSLRANNLGPWQPDPKNTPKNKHEKPATSSIKPCVPPYIVIMSNSTTTNNNHYYNITITKSENKE